jgi:HSP90 family molecular chaperone
MNSPESAPTPSAPDATPWRRTIPFKVDIAGIIEIMGSSLYSRATTPVRELIQNAHDGIMRRRAKDLSFKGRIDISQNADAGSITFTDDGIGLDAGEAERYLGTLGVGITGLIKKGLAAADGGLRSVSAGDGQTLIGQFGVGLFSAFMLAERLVVETRKCDGSPAVRWEAGPGTDISLASSDREAFGTSVTLFLKEDYRFLSQQLEPLEEAVKEYADFLPVPIHLNGQPTRANLITAAWFDPTPERESIELELESFFHETALEVIPVRSEKPAAIAGALYVTPQRTPGFSGEPVVTVTIRRMVISRRVQGLLPTWASFLRGVLEVNGCSPTASREDLVRDGAFDRTRDTLETLLYEHFEALAERDLARMQSILSWHRYAFAGAALTNDRLRALLRRCYPFGTSRGPLTFDQIVAASAADALFEDDASHVIWFNSDRRQESWANTLFAGDDRPPCVHAVRSFEESLLAAMASDAMRDGKAAQIDLRPASPGAPNFSRSILGLTDAEDAPETWQQFLAATGARAMIASFDERTPVMAFLNERHELLRTFEDLKKSGEVPSAFQRLIDQHFADDRPMKNEVLLNRKHPLVKRALDQKSSHPLASVLRLLVTQSLAAAGATVPDEARRQQAEDLDWVGEALWVRGK